MPVYMILSWIFIIAGLVCTVFVLVLQWRAWRRFRHVSFGLLTISSIAVLIDQLLMAIPYVHTLDATALASLMALAAIPFAHALVLGVWGTWSLFRAYGRVVEENVRLREGLGEEIDA
ncbi:hypothetical protein [Pseudoxanthomonas sp. SE1]|uniref:hypothetical protein n=1 Tax=Pseudoxanthomonas sp. SE1 TaxID=1664560 RepID=UPI00240E04FC|nr:hypothetical protein [Pseudoxanthomonas sp. SE1]WFC40834.1 hypothetical protein OY559_13580 [Pseudoxanthomonas sp. SE1]